MENSFITMDIETISLNNKQFPIAITFCDNYNSKFFFNTQL